MDELLLAFIMMVGGSILTAYVIFQRLLNKQVKLALMDKYKDL